MAPEGIVEQPLRDGGREAAPLGPCGHGARLLLAERRVAREDRRALGRGRDDVDVLQDQLELRPARVGQEAERPEIGLAEMPEADQPEAGGQVAQRRRARVAATSSQSDRRRFPEDRARRVRRPATATSPETMEKGLVDGQRGGQHRRERHRAACAGADLQREPGTIPPRQPANTARTREAVATLRRARPPIAMSGMPAAAAPDVPPQGHDRVARASAPKGSGTASGTSRSPATVTPPRKTRRASATAVSSAACDDDRRGLVRPDREREAVAAKQRLGLFAACDACRCRWPA